MSASSPPPSLLLPPLLVTACLQKVTLHISQRRCKEPRPEASTSPLPNTSLTPGKPFEAFLYKSNDLWNSLFPPEPSDARLKTTMDEQMVLASSHFAHTIGSAVWCNHQLLLLHLIHLLLVQLPPKPIRVTQVEVSCSPWFDKGLGPGGMQEGPWSKQGLKSLTPSSLERLLMI